MNAQVNASGQLQVEGYNRLLQQQTEENRWLKNELKHKRNTINCLLIIIIMMICIIVKKEYQSNPAVASVVPVTSCDITDIEENTQSNTAEVYRSFENTILKQQDPDPTTQQTQPQPQGQTQQDPDPTQPTTNTEDINVGDDLYESSNEQWNVYAASKDLTITKRTVNHTGFEYNVSSAFLTNVVFQGAHHWQFKVEMAPNSSVDLFLGNVSNSNLYFGICIDDNHEWKNGHIHTILGSIANTCYVFNCRIAMINKHSMDNKWTLPWSYGKVCEYGDVIDMFLNFDPLLLSFSINGAHYGIAHNIKPNHKYIAAISSGAQYNYIELTTYDHEQDKELQEWDILEGWDKNAITLGIAINNHIVKHDKAIFGVGTAFLVNVVESGQHHWKFKIIGRHHLIYNDTKGPWILFGIWNVENEAQTWDRLGKEANTAYVFDSFAQRLNIHESGEWTDLWSYGSLCWNNDVVDMWLDFDELSLSFSINDTYYGKSHTIKAKRYIAAISSMTNHSDVELLLYDNQRPNN